MEKLKNMLCKELDEFSKKQKISASELDIVWKLTDTVKNIAKIDMLEGGSEMGHSRTSYDNGSSYDDESMYSERRGRGRYAKRDRMGRYSSEGGASRDGMTYDNSYDDYAEDGGMSERYSRHDAKDHMMRKLGAMMEDANPKEREVLKECMRALERA